MYDWEQELFLAHYGVKGMKWGVRKEVYKSMSRGDRAKARYDYMDQKRTEYKQKQTQRKLKRDTKLVAKGKYLVSNSLDSAKIARLKSIGKAALKVGLPIAAATLIGPHLATATGALSVAARQGIMTTIGKHTYVYQGSTIRAANEAIKTVLPILGGVTIASAIGGTVKSANENRAIGKYQKSSKK